MSRPWRLGTALSGADGTVQPGDTVWLHGGAYRGAFTSTLSGTPDAPVVVRQYPGERAIIDGARDPRSTLAVWGPWSVFWGFELTNSDPIRTASSSASDTRPDVVYNAAAHTKYINLVIHDGGVAFYTEPAATDVEVSGSIIYNNGWQGPERGHGHGLYLKSDAGPVVARGNVVFNQFGYGVHVYSNAGSGRLNNIRLEHNVVFNNGTLSSDLAEPNILIGGEEPADGIALVGNHTYLSPGRDVSNVQLGWGSVPNGVVALDGNTLVGGSPVLDARVWSSATVVRNALAGERVMVSLVDPLPANHTWVDNRYFRDPTLAAWEYGGVARPFGSWRDVAGVGASDHATAAPPVQPAVTVWADPYETGRAIVVVHNWGRHPFVYVDLSAVLAPGDGYEIRNVENLFGEPLAAGIYDGMAMPLPMSGFGQPVPAGFDTSPAPAAGPDLGVFVAVRPP
jgi:hypothetical protein